MQRHLSTGSTILSALMAAHDRVDIAAGRQTPTAEIFRLLAAMREGQAGNRSGQGSALDPLKASLENPS